MGFNWQDNVMCHATGHWTFAIALYPKLQTDEESGAQTVFWFDPQHHRAFDVSRIVRDEQNEFVAEVDHPKIRRIKLVPMTLALFNKHVRPVLMADIKFSSAAEMQEYYIRQFGELG